MINSNLFIKIILISVCSFILLSCSTSNGKIDYRQNKSGCIHLEAGEAPDTAWALSDPELEVKNKRRDLKEKNLLYILRKKEN